MAPPTHSSKKARRGGKNPDPPLPTPQKLLDSLEELGDMEENDPNREEVVDSLLSQPILYFSSLRQARLIAQINYQGSVGWKTINGDESEKNEAVTALPRSVLRLRGGGGDAADDDDDDDDDEEDGEGGEEEVEVEVEVEEGEEVEVEVEVEEEDEEEWTAEVDGSIMFMRI